MNSRLLLCFLSLLALTPLHGQGEFDPARLVGHWRYEDGDHATVADYVFRKDGTFTAELKKGGELIRRFDGHWTIEENFLVYTYKKDSLGQIDAGQRERDLLLRVDKSSYTIVAGDREQRTYWRVKEEK